MWKTDVSPVSSCIICLDHSDTEKASSCILQLLNSRSSVFWCFFGWHQVQYSSVWSPSRYCCLILAFIALSNGQRCSWSVSIALTKAVLEEIARSRVGKQQQEARKMNMQSNNGLRLQIMETALFVSKETALTTDWAAKGKDVSSVIKRGGVGFFAFL